MDDIRIIINLYPSNKLNKKINTNEFLDLSIYKIFNFLENINSKIKKLFIQVLPHMVFLKV